MTIIQFTLHARGMHCTSCERLIRRAVGALPGIEAVQADYATERVRIGFDPSRVSIRQICRSIENSGYRCELKPRRTSARTRWRRLGLGLALTAVGFALLVVGAHYAQGLEPPTLRPGIGYGLLFGIGFLTGFHCIGMCGPFVLGYTAHESAARRHRLRSHLLYGLAKTLSYAGMGALFGALGALIEITPQTRAAAALLGGLFLVTYGLKVLHWFPDWHWLRWRLPLLDEGQLLRRLPGTSSPFLVGLANGLMLACGPLQAVYVLAAGVGDPWEGAKLAAAFGLGTLPPLLGFGLIASYLSSALTNRLLQYAGGLILLLGLVMVNRGLVLTGTGLDAHSLWIAATERRASGEPLHRQPQIQEIRMVANASGYQPNHFELTQGIPVRWRIVGEKITACNRVIVVPRLGLEFELHPGMNLIEFTPREAGLIPWSCWMGMLHGSFRVRPMLQTPSAAPVYTGGQGSRELRRSARSAGGR